MESDVVQDLDSNITMSSAYQMPFICPGATKKRNPEVRVEGNSPLFPCVLHRHILVISAGWISSQVSSLVDPVLLSILCTSLGKEIK